MYSAAPAAYCSASRQLTPFAYEFYTYDIDTEKLDAAMEMTDIKSSKNIITLIDHLDEFEYLNDISYGDYEGIGRYFVDNDYYDEYEISEEHALEAVQRFCRSLQEEGVLEHV